MGTTPSGLPYPEPTEPVRNGAANIKALATAIDIRGGGLLVQAGSSVINTNQAGDANVVPAVAYQAGSKPILYVAVSDPLGAYICSPNANATSSQFCPFRLFNADGNALTNYGPVRVNWITVGPSV
jgi:hypothetical protein